MNNYEDKYKQALEKATFYNGELPTKEQRKMLLDIFPELSENENERMKKAITHILYENYTDAAVIEGVEIAEIVTWLEKQGKTLEPDKVIGWLEDKQPSVALIDKFKKDFGL